MNVLEEYLMPNYRDHKQHMTIMGDHVFDGTRYWIALDTNKPEILWYIWNNAKHSEQHLNEVTARCVTYEISVIRKIRSTAFVYKLHRAALGMLDKWNDPQSININEVF